MYLLLLLKINFSVLIPNTVNIDSYNPHTQKLWDPQIVSMLKESWDWKVWELLL